MGQHQVSVLRLIGCFSSRRNRGHKRLCPADGPLGLGPKDMVVAVVSGFAQFIYPFQRCLVLGWIDLAPVNQLLGKLGLHIVVTPFAVRCRWCYTNPFERTNRCLKTGVVTAVCTVIIPPITKLTFRPSILSCAFSRYKVGCIVICAWYRTE